jgi:hypothetical protein
VIVLSIGVAAVGINSWVAPRDLVFTGARKGNTACNVAITTIPAWTAANTIVDPGTWGVLYYLGPNSSGLDSVKIPVEAGQRIFVAFSALGDCILYFDEVSS